MVLIKDGQGKIGKIVKKLTFMVRIKQEKLLEFACIGFICLLHLYNRHVPSLLLKLKGLWKTHPFFFAKFHSQPHSIISFTLLSKYKYSLPSLTEISSTKEK